MATAAAEPLIAACLPELAVVGRRGRRPRTRGSAPLKRDKRSLPKIPGLQVVLW